MLLKLIIKALIILNITLFKQIYIDSNNTVYFNSVFDFRIFFYNPKNMLIIL